MLYLVGGASRSGKSLLAERMRVRHGIAYLSLDAVKMGLHKGAPALGIDAEADDLMTADHLWPIVEPLLDHLLFDGRDYLVEGVNLRPRAIAAFIADTDQPVRSCFLGYPDIDIGAKAAAVARHIGVPTDWLHRTGPENVRRYLTVSRALSQVVREECRACGLPFIDTGADFHKALASAEKALIEGDPSGTPCGSSLAQPWNDIAASPVCRAGSVLYLAKMLPR